MTRFGNIAILDIYRLLSYSLRDFSLLSRQTLSTEDISNLEIVLTEILIDWVTLERKRGLEHDYLEVCEELQFVRGRFHVLASELNRLRGRLAAVCTFDEYLVDTTNNRMLKASLKFALTLSNVKGSQKARIVGLLPFFDSVADVAVTNINWRAGRFDRNNLSYKTMRNICYLLINGLSLSDADNDCISSGVTVSNLPILYQKFITSYISLHFLGLKVSSERVLTDGIDISAGAVPSQLPRLQPDIVVERYDKKLVIDTKFYSSVLIPNRFGKCILRPAHRNQISMYVSHASIKRDQVKEGLLLFARPEGENDDISNFCWRELGSTFYCSTIDLNQRFDVLSRSLDEILWRHFPGEPKTLF